MRIKFQTQIGKAAEAEAGRYAMGNVIVTPDGKAVAINGRIAAVTNVEVRTEEGEEFAVVPSKLIDKKVGVGKMFDVNDGKAKRYDKNKTVEGEAAYGRLPSSLSFVFPGFHESDIDSGSCVALTLDVGQLASLADAINSQENKVTLLLHLDQKDKGCVTSTIGVLGDTGFGCMASHVYDGEPIREKVKEYRQLAADMESIDVALRAYNKVESYRVEAENEKEKEAATA